MEKLKLTPVEKNGQRVLTTAQLAEAYDTTVNTINRNFNNNKSRYIEGIHYYCLKGEKLKEFFATEKFTGANSRKIRTLYLWTERGVLLHAKSLNTKKAWEVYVFLMENYFHTRQMTTSYDNISMQVIENQLNVLNNSLIKIIENQKAMQKQIDDIINYGNHVLIPFIKGIIKKLK
ncbi:MAG: ORF6N domain-containing protein [Ruminococcus sp.]|nr:ORF6N domain-containing protein [Ruminococcus sp.]